MSKCQFLRRGLSGVSTKAGKIFLVAAFLIGSIIAGALLFNVGEVSASTRTKLIPTAENGTLFNSNYERIYPNTTNGKWGGPLDPNISPSFDQSQLNISGITNIKDIKYWQPFDEEHSTGVISLETLSAAYDSGGSAIKSRYCSGDITNEEVAIGDETGHITDDENGIDSGEIDSGTIETDDVTKTAKLRKISGQRSWICTFASGRRKRNLNDFVDIHDAAQQNGEYFDMRIYIWSAYGTCAPGMRIGSFIGGQFRFSGSLYRECNGETMFEYHFYDSGTLFATGQGENTDLGQKVYDENGNEINLNPGDIYHISNPDLSHERSFKGVLRYDDNDGGGEEGYTVLEGFTPKDSDSSNRVPISGSGGWVPKNTHMRFTMGNYTAGGNKVSKTQIAVKSFQESIGRDPINCTYSVGAHLVTIHGNQSSNPVRDIYLCPSWGSTSTNNNGNTWVDNYRSIWIAFENIINSRSRSDNQILTMSYFTTSHASSYTVLPSMVNLVLVPTTEDGKVSPKAQEYVRKYRDSEYGKYYDTITDPDDLTNYYGSKSFPDKDYYGQLSFPSSSTYQQNGNLLLRRVPVIQYGSFRPSNLAPEFKNDDGVEECIVDGWYAYPEDIGKEDLRVNQTIVTGMPAAGTFNRDNSTNESVYKANLKTLGQHGYLNVTSPKDPPTSYLRAEYNYPNLPDHSSGAYKEYITKDVSAGFQTDIYALPYGFKYYDNNVASNKNAKLLTEGTDVDRKIYRGYSYVYYAKAVCGSYATRVNSYRSFNSKQTIENGEVANFDFKVEVDRKDPNDESYIPNGVRYETAYFYLPSDFDFNTSVGIKGTSNTTGDEKGGQGYIGDANNNSNSLCAYLVSVLDARDCSTGDTGSMYMWNDSSSESLRRKAVTVKSDKEDGSKICAVIGVNVGATGENHWNVSGASCYTIVRKPTLQVWNGSFYTNGSISTSNTSLNFGSWSEFNVIAGGTTTGFASGAAFSSKLNSRYNSAVGGCDRYPMTLGNTTCTQSNSPTSGSEAGSTASASGVNKGYSIDTIATELNRRFNINTSQEETILSHYTVGGTDPNVRVLNGIRLGSSGNIFSSGNTIVLNYTNGVDAEINIKGNVCLSDSCGVDTSGQLKTASSDTATYRAANEVPQIIIIADKITIDANVTQIDAWLIAKKINTCTQWSSSGDSTICSNTLKVNGPVFTGELALKRTAGGKYYDPISANNANGTSDLNGNTGEIFDLHPSTFVWAFAQTDSLYRLYTSYAKELSPRY